MKEEKKVYILPNTKTYHSSKSCHSLLGKDNIIERSENDCKQEERTFCKNCKNREKRLGGQTPSQSDDLV